MGRECGSSTVRDLIRVAGLHRSSSSALPEADLDALFAYLGHMARQKDVVSICSNALGEPSKIHRRIEGLCAK